MLDSAVPDEWRQKGVDAILTAKMLAKLLNVSRQTLGRLYTSCNLPEPIFFAGGYVWRRSHIIAWMDEKCPDRYVWKVTGIYIKRRLAERLARQKARRERPRHVDG